METPIHNMLEPDRDAQRRREFQIQQERAFKSINLLAGGIAHDFNNVIAGILGSAEVIKMDHPPDHPDNQILEQIFTAGKRASQMIHQLKNFSRRQPSKRALILLPPIVEEALKLFRANLPATVEMACQLDQDCPAVLADAAQIQEVLINLCLNASHSLAGQKGRIDVRLETCDVDGNRAACSELHAGSQVRLSIRHNGDPVSKSVLGRMFEPFACKQTTGYDSGLELFAAREIVHAHEGAITVDSAPGEGTVFHLYFPIPSNDDGEKSAAGAAPVSGQPLAPAL